MTYRIVFLILSVFATHSLQSQQRLTLPEALAQNIVQISVHGSGGFQGECLQMAVKNLQSQIVSLEIPAGYIFSSEDTAVQDLMVTSSATLALEARSTKRTHLYTMCTQSSNVGPKKGEKFLAGNMAKGDLLTLAQKISDKGYQNSTAQSAVWTIANQEPVRHIYGEDTTMVRDIAETVSAATGVPITEFHIVPRRHQITAIRTSLEVLIPRHLKQASLGLYDQEGNLIREYFDGKAVEKGFMQWRVGASHTLGDSAEVFLRLKEGEELISERQVFVSDRITPLQRIHSEAVMVYTAKEDVTATVGIYDAQDRLYFLLAGERHIPKGIHRSRFIAGKSLPFDQEYFVKVKVGEEVLASQRLDVHAPPPKLYPKRSVSDKAVFHLKEGIQNGRLAIYDSQGRLKRILYEVPAMQAGTKKINYSFQHRQGRGAKFYLRLTDTEGKVVVEQEIVDEKK